MERTSRERAPHRVRRLFAAWGLCCLTVLVGLFAGPAPKAYAWDQPKPVTLMPGTGGSPTTTGPATVDPPGPKGKIIDATALVLAGVGAFEGTCYLLGEMFSDPDGCDSGINNILGAFGFGPNGDDRSREVSGSVGTLDVSGYPGPGQAWTITADPAAGDGTAALNRTRLRVQYYYSATDQTATCDLNGLSSNFTSSAPRTVSLPAVGNCGGSGGTIASIAFFDFNDTIIETPPTGLWVHQNGWYWAADTGLGTSWDIDFERQCRAPSGTTFTVNGSTGTFTPTDNMTIPQPDVPACWDVTPGSTQTGLKVEGGRDTVENPDVKIDWPTFSPEAQTDYPLCTTGGPSDGCWLDLQKDGKSCFSAGVYCAGWQQKVTTWNMTCEWGPYTVPIAKCEAKYGTKFDTQPQPKPTPGPTPGPTAPPGTGTNPQTPPTQPGTGTNPDSTGCFGEAFTLNPVDWVYVPVKCALLWAFKPQTSLQTRVSTVQTAYADAPPFTWFAQLGALPTGIGSSGCPDWEIKVANLDKNVVCDSSYTDALRAGRPVFAAMMIAAAFAPFLRSLAYSAVPILSPVPH